MGDRRKMSHQGNTMDWGRDETIRMIPDDLFWIPVKT
jgi:hypothetical protein